MAYRARLPGRMLLALSAILLIPLKAASQAGEQPYLQCPGAISTQLIHGDGSDFTRHFSEADQHPLIAWLFQNSKILVEHSLDPYSKYSLTSTYFRTSSSRELTFMECRYTRDSDNRYSELIFYIAPGHPFALNYIQELPADKTFCEPTINAQTGEHECNIHAVSKPAFTYIRNSILNLSGYDYQLFLINSEQRSDRITIPEKKDTLVKRTGKFQLFLQTAFRVRDISHLCSADSFMQLSPDKPIAIELLGQIPPWGSGQLGCRVNGEMIGFSSDNPQPEYTRSYYQPGYQRRSSHICMLGICITLAPFPGLIPISSPLSRQAFWQKEWIETHHFEYNSHAHPRYQQTYYSSNIPYENTREAPEEPKAKPKAKKPEPGSGPGSGSGSGKDPELISAYEELGLPDDSTMRTVKAKYRELALKYHPDKPTGDREKFERIAAAYETIRESWKK